MTDERPTYECGECGKVSGDGDHIREHWFWVDLPHRDIESMRGITYCEPDALFCSVGCFSAFGDRLVRVQLTGTDKLGVV